MATKSSPTQKTTDTDLYKELCNQCDFMKIEFGDTESGKKEIMIDGKCIDRFYYVKMTHLNNISKKREIKKTIYNYILINRLKVVGGKFGGMSLARVRVLYHCT